MSLLQAAFSLYGFARNWEQKNSDGSFRHLVDLRDFRRTILITHTTSGKAVGMAYY